MPVREWGFYAVGLGFVLGVGAATLFPAVQFDGWFFVCVGIALGVVGLRKSTHLVAALALCSLAIACGLWRTAVYEASLVSSVDWPIGSETTFTGVVTKEPDEREVTTHLYVKTEAETVLVTTDRHEPVAYGDLVSVTGVIKEPEPFATDLGRTFNYPGYLKSKGVMHVVSYADVTVKERGHGYQLIASLLQLKSAFLRSIELQLPEPQAGLSEGLLLGVKRALGSELEEVFRRTGIIHIVVLSGYNIMLVVAFVLYILSLVLPWRARLAVGLLAIIGFALIVGLSATVVRASIMAGLALVARAFGRTYTVLRALLVAGLIMLAINPYLLVFDVGFQLSFLATLGLILGAPLLEKPLHRVPTIIGIREFLIATVVTQVFVLPILLYQIGEFSLVSVIVNVLVLPMVPVAMLATFVVVLISFVSSTLAVPVTWLAYVSLSYIITIPTFFAQVPFAAFVVPAFPFWVVMVAYAALGYGMYRFYTPRAPLAGWQIEEESAHIPTPQPKEDLPAFFR